MGLNWFESILYGLISGLTDIIPVSAEAHKIILQKIFGMSYEPELMRLLIHVAVLAALYLSSSPFIVKIARAKRLARTPKKRRKRPLDTKSLMDFSLLKTMLLPVVLAFFFYEKASSLGNNMIVLSSLIFVNGLVLYIPQYLPGSNKDSRMLSRLDGLFMGMGGALSVVPGFSGIGVSLSIGSVCGVDKNYGLAMTLLMNVAIVIGCIIFDVKDIMSGGIGIFDISVLLQYILSAGAAFAGTVGGIRIMRHMAKENGFTVFSYYCWGVALFTFVLNLIA